MKLKTLSLILLFSVFFVISSYSQYKYEIQLESFNGNNQREVIIDIAEYLEDYERNHKDGVFFFKSKTRYTEEDFREIAAAAGYKIIDFKIVAKNEDEKSNIKQNKN